MPNSYFTSTSNANMSYNNTDGYAIKKSQSDSPDLPSITFTTSDEYGNTVVMTLAPEGGIPSSDVMKLLMLVVATMSGGSNSFNSLAWAKKNNLERHFTYS